MLRDDSTTGAQDISLHTVGAIHEWLHCLPVVGNVILCAHSASLGILDLSCFTQVALAK